MEFLSLPFLLHSDLTSPPQLPLAAPSARRRRLRHFRRRHLRRLSATCSHHRLRRSQARPLTRVSKDPHQIWHRRHRDLLPQVAYIYNDHPLIVSLTTTMPALTTATISRLTVNINNHIWSPRLLDDVAHLCERFLPHLLETPHRPCHLGALSRDREAPSPLSPHHHHHLPRRRLRRRMLLRPRSFPLRKLFFSPQRRRHPSRLLVPSLPTPMSYSQGIRQGLRFRQRHTAPSLPPLQRRRLRRLQRRRRRRQSRCRWQR